MGETFPEKPIYALFGGLHLHESADEDVRALAERVRRTGIRKIYTGHCTGDRALEILKEELGDTVEAIYSGFTVDDMCGVIFLVNEGMSGNNGSCATGL